MSDDDYEVGYGRPPVAGRFQRGQSGNPRGRRKGSKNVSTMIEDALNAKVVVNINGRRRTVSKLQAAFIQTANKAAGGDGKAMKLMLDMMAGAESREEAKTGGEPISREVIRAQNQSILSSLRARLIAENDSDG